MGVTGLALDIPGRGALDLVHLVLDVNGTLACDGALLPGVAERLNALRPVLELHLLTADTHGRQAAIDRQLDLQAVRIRPGEEGEQKAAYLRQLNGGAAALGNGANDVLLLQTAALGIAVLGPEGLCCQTLLAAPILCSSITEALDLLRNPNRLRATLRR